MSNNLLFNAVVTRPRGRVRAVAAALAVTLVASLVAGSTPAVVAANQHPALRPEKVIPHVDVPLAAPRQEPVRPAAQSVSWPAVGEAVVAVDGEERQAGSLPVRLRAEGQSGDVRVRMLSKEHATRAGVSGVITTLSPTKGAVDSVTMDLDYAGFAGAGANFGSRLTLVTLPSCVLVTPEKPECQVQTPLKARNEYAAQHVEATVSLREPLVEGLTTPSSAGAAGTEMVVASVGESAGPQGNYAASSLSPSGTWSVSGNSGSFGWSYPIGVPPSAAGPAPSVALSYGSSGVDGLTSGTNNQSSWIGLGWNYSPGFIERTYRTCSQDPAVPAARQTPDLCWAGPIVTLNLGGRSTPLVFDGTNWVPESDDGEKVVLGAGAVNGARDGEHWKVTTTDGTEYWFGRDSLPGIAGPNVTNSAWTVPVTHPLEVGHQCQSAASLALPACAHAWRWNLDYVRDTHGNAAAYYYTKETNSYGANNATTLTPYTRGGWLDHVDYGLRESGGSIAGQTAPNKVTFEVVGRCTAFDPNANPPSDACASVTLTTANKETWRDVPVDQNCTVSPCNVHAPTFWSTKRLRKINTSYKSGTTDVLVDSYTLKSSVDPADEHTLQLDSITHTGYDAAQPPLSTPPVTFSYAAVLDNRVEGYITERGDLPPMQFPRLSNVRSETGADTQVDYTNEVETTQPACTNLSVPTELSNNGRLCYPVKWTMPGNQNPTPDYFHKWVVKQVRVQDTTGGDGSPTQYIDYKYTSPGWHFDDNELVKPEHRTYGQFRGFATVETLTGNPAYTPPTAGVLDKQTYTKSTYFRGMHGDKLLPSGTRSVKVKNSLNEEVDDLDQYAGTAFETETFLGAGGARLSRSISTPITVATTATRDRAEPLPDLFATITATERSRDITDLPGGGTRTAETRSRFDGTGRVVAQTSLATGLTDLCATTEYATHATIKTLVKQTIASTGACPASGPQTSITAAAQTFYDGSTTLGAVPGPGDATRAEVATSLDAQGNPVYQTTGSATFDLSGRVLTTTDARNFTTTTTYTPLLGGIVSQIDTKNPKNQTTTVTLAPGRGTPLTTTDVAGRVSQARYDQLGRVVEVWQPGRAATAKANVKYEYKLRNDGPLAVTTRALVDNGVEENYLTSIALYDSLGRQRQTQVDDVANPTAVNNRVVAEVIYDSHGWPIASNNRYLTTNAPGTELISVSAANVDDRTITTYDGAGRPVNVKALKGAAVTREVSTVYGGDRVTTIPPAGGVPSTVVSDARGRTTSLVQYTTAPTVNGTTVSGGSPQSTTYKYNDLGQLVELADAANIKWGFEFDFLGRQTARVDPDSGRSTTAYDLAGQVTSTTDALNQVLSYEYDELGRKIASKKDGTTLASWVYDTALNGKGKLHSSTRHVSPGVDYTVKTTGYNGRGMPVDQIVTVPSAQTGLAGDYKTQFGYTSTNLPTYVTPAHAGGLPGENIQFTYDRHGQALTTRGVNMIVAASTYSSAGEPLRYALGGLDQVALTFGRDTHTHRVSQITMTAVKATPQIDDVVYTYDPAGNLTKAHNVQGASTKRTECFNYDSLARLTQAWTSATENACATTPAAGNVGGGVTPYWTTWEFNPTGSRTKQVQHQITGGVTADTTTNYTPFGPTETGPRHAVKSTTTTGPAGPPTTSYTYDAAGNTTGRTLPGVTQKLDWDPTGRLATVDLDPSTPATTDSSYIYDADGGQLVRTEPGKTTLYLPGQEIVRNTTTGAVTGTRYYTHNGAPIAVRNTGENPTYLKADVHGTNQVAVASNGYTVTRRTQDPYGNPLGTTNPWIDNHGFLNKPVNTTTGLTDIGARNYDPTTGRFVSVDPLLDMANPQSWNGYNYANNNPTTHSDPTGLIADYDNEKQEARYAEENKAFSDEKKPVRYTIPTGKAQPDNDQDRHAPYREAGFWDYMTPWSSFNGLKDMAIGVQLFACHRGPVACSLFDHWLGRSGSDYQLDRLQMAAITDDPGFVAGVSDLLNKMTLAAVDGCSGSPGSACTLDVDSGWTGFMFEHNEDMQFAFHSIEYRVTATSRATVLEDNSIEVAGTYKVDVFKAYNFDPWKDPITLWGMEFDVKDISKMPENGLARDFSVHGAEYSGYHAVIPR
ncbi:MAG TPA: RHS repeat-associated core domain-containing protein [Actinokineospora sp.]|nr:RHS repeat-associated core domain-containing protein [Actinokineospora sp.]